MDHAADFVAGCLAGCAGVLVGHPFDTVKVRLQAQSSRNVLYRNTFHCFKSIIAKEGSRGLYKGVTSPLYSLTFINAIVFGVQGNTIRQMDQSLTSHFIAGSVAGFAQCWVCSPMELAKIRMQSQGQGEKGTANRTYTSAVDCLRKIYRIEGFRGVFKGMNITILREIPSFGVYFATYEYLCQMFTPKDAKHCPTYGLLISGGIAGCNSWAFSYPIDVIKTRIQQDGSLIDGKFYYRYSSYMDCVRKSVAEDGYRVFLKGLSPTLSRAFVTNAATFPVYTLAIRYLRPGEPAEDHNEALERASMIAQHEG